MKFKKILETAKLNLELCMIQEEYIADAQLAAESFSKEVKKLFPNANIVRSNVSKNLGNALHFIYIGDEFTVTKHNAKEYLEFICHLDDYYNQKPDADKNKFEIEFMTGSHQFRDKGLKYRKISAKSPTEATKKLIDWFKKNKTIISSE